MPGASMACPPQMTCQGGTLGYADVCHLRQGRSLRGADGETITPDALAEPQPIILARVVRTCVAVPSQWNAWTTSGQYLYLRYRSGIGTVDAYGNPDPETWTRAPDGAVARFDTGDRLDGEMTIEEFCERAGLELAVAEVTGEPQDNVQEHDTEAWDVPDARRAPQTHPTLFDPEAIPQ
jgi:hypothetical protein